MEPEIIASLVALVASLAAAVIALRGQRGLRLLEEELKRREESLEYLAKQLSELYIPVSMNLAATNVLFHRFFEAPEEEKAAIEHELRIHNLTIREVLIGRSFYLEVEAPEDLLEDLLEHLIQWEIVYKLKYEYKVYSGPVFAGIKDFGFRGFPQGADKYFREGAKRLKMRYNSQFTQE
jgi:hypothetical protein